MNYVNYIVYSKVGGRRKLLIPNFDSLLKHWKRKTISTMLVVKLNFFIEIKNLHM